MKKRLWISLGVVAAILLLTEIGLRVAGFKPYKGEFAALEMTPEWMYASDSTLGLRIQPGVYDIKELEQYSYRATIDSNGYRINPLVDTPNAPIKPQIIFLGAGSTFGQGLSDQEAYPFVLQSLVPQYRVRNQAVMGYGVANNYVQLMNLKNYRPGDIVVYIYHADQDNRYRLANQKGIYGTFSKHPHFQNYQYLSIDENLNTAVHTYDYSPLPLSGYSALVNHIDDMHNHYVDSRDRSNEIARKAILAMAAWSKDHGIDFKLVCWKSDDLSLQTLAYLQQNGVNTYHIPYVIGFDHIPQEELAPANRAFADSLVRVLHIEQNPVSDSLAAQTASR